MAEHFEVCLIGAMDRLWFHRIILFSSEPLSKTLHKPSSESPPTPDSVLSSTSTFQEEESPSVQLVSPVSDLLQDPSNSSFITDDDCGNQEEERETCEQCKRPTMRLDSLDRKRSHSSSPSKQNRRNRRRHSDSVRSLKLEKSMSSRDLELEELKGFMDLGFRFKEENLNKRMMSVVPGLQRLGLSRSRGENGGEEETEEEEEDRGVMRPYLSEAWLIRRPNSPLLNLSLPRVHAAADMKKLLRSWARTVASVVQQEW